MGFALGLLLALVSGCASSTRPAATPVQTGAASSRSSAWLTQNPDGTITIEERSSTSSSSKGKDDFAIPAQVIAPIEPTSHKQQDATQPH
jgi:hypothetical protein